MISAFTILPCGAVVLDLEDSNGAFEAKNERVVKSGEEYRIKVRTEGGKQIDNCNFKFGEKALRIREKSEKYFGAGFNKGECGILIQAINLTFNGPVSLSVNYPDIDEVTTATFVLLVVSPITELLLETNKDVLEQGDNLKISCKTIGARPDPKLQIFFGMFIPNYLYIFLTDFPLFCFPICR
jgi:hypothetical protein